MSSKPSPKGVEDLRGKLRDLQFLSKRIAELETLVAELPKLKEEAGRLSSEVIKGLEGMDVAHSGNGGWENRMLWFLSEFDRQAWNDPAP